jgi:hypothetical protein
MPRHFILRIGNFLFSIVLKEANSSDVEAILVTDYQTGEQVCINESDMANVFHEISIGQRV